MKAAIRCKFGNFLTELLPARIAEMRALSPLWRKQAARAAGAR